MMNKSMHVFLSVCVLIADYVIIWFGKGDTSLAWYTNLAVLVSLGLITVTDNLVAMWKK